MLSHSRASARGMGMFFKWIVALLCAFPVAALAQDVPPGEASDPRPVTILISIDGFHPDYLERGITPNLVALAERGVSLPMTPSFPTKTFPNHYTIVTGLRPDHHGIVSNNMLDPRRPDVTFSLGNQRQSLDPFWWDEAEPIWVTAERAGVRTGAVFWPGSEVEIGGVRPSDWLRFHEAVSNRQRVDTILDWMRRPADIRPAFATLYFDAVDTAGHRFGTDSAEVNAAIAEIDGQIGYLVDGLAEMEREADIIVVSDHGMGAVDAARVIQLDEILEASAYLLLDSGPFATIEAAPGTDRRVFDALLVDHAHMECWEKDAIPARLHYGSNPRVAAILCLAEPGWSIIRGVPPHPVAGATHGWDPADPRMTALFIAAGPRIATATPVPDLENVDVYALLAALIGIPPLSNDGGEDALTLLAGAAPSSANRLKDTP